MTAQMEKVIERVSDLSDSQQDDLAFFWVQDLESEIGFDAKISETASKLAVLANKALAEFDSGKTINIGFDKL